MLFSCSLQAQVGEQAKDTVKTGVDLGKIEIPNPKSILDSYTYDPITDRYIYTKSVDGFNINYPLILTPKQYQDLMLREQMRDYYQEKSAAIDGKKSGTDAAKRNLLPVYRVNSKIFETIFGSNTIDIKPTGSVELDLGVRFTKQDNPSFSPRNRRTTSFDFTQRISVGLQGKVGTRLSVNINYDTQSTFAFQNLIKLRQKYHNICEEHYDESDEYYHFWRGAYNAVDSCQREILKTFNSEKLNSFVENNQWQL